LEFDTRTVRAELVEACPGALEQPFDKLRADGSLI